MSTIFENVKGTQDFLPERQIVREEIKQKLREKFMKYGFAPIETPILCSYDLLASKYSEGADILNEMYTLTDQGRRKLGLRYDLTITFSKLVSSNKDIVLPFKRFEIGRVYRDGPVKLGRYREFTQCDVDVVGVKSMMAEAEYMMMINEVYKELGLDIEVEFNNRKLLVGIIEYVLGDLPEDNLRRTVMLIDKFAKLTDEELIAEFALMDVSAEDFNKLRALLKLDYTSLKAALANVESTLIREGLEEIDDLYRFLEDTEALTRMKFAPYLARGIDIYTGTVWEIFLKNREIAGQEFTVSVGGGGRFDKIITTFVDDGNEYPAVGMSFGLDVIYAALALKNAGKRTATVDLFVIPMGTEYASFKLASKLRDAGLRVEVEKNNKKLKKTMAYANKMAFPYVIILGETEIREKMIRVKVMETGEVSDFAIDDYDGIAEFIKS